MLLDEVKATLAMENLYLTEEQEKLLQSYADGEISFKEFQEQIAKLTEDSKVA
ncbi:MAG: antitoxin VbhA family protein [Succinivibrio dextrinosolvens]|uniref:antitoxin VbhA family protein n=1 Tax=Succinivibrio sp. TaxID=2053619 RepID=UPI0025D8E486|nr:antitoxin VbhA family protein [Succinivibrio sp.]MDY6416825.1 antitoxin VbhA family protein [Succinivibrio dextrinosolvens]MBQ9219831.1 antitoxin VbhA family protein [Succinivibrio sp.]MDY6419198.1 antitoxin VbhA family protein [Succinivibrio dextrinosolvens]MDY6465264.1 antitoxin VbhA family protein [Succinivibrio dextrinosolvens]MDY6470892.1 antitoxin VbhA family protein [Succinivibrio dextrinosolvens]